MDLRWQNMELQQQTQIDRQNFASLTAAMQANYEQSVRLTKRANAKGGDQISMPPPLVIPGFSPTADPE